MPFCPACRCEYREGATLCSTCGAAPVGALPLELDRQPRTGLAPLDRVVNWLRLAFLVDYPAPRSTRFCPICRYEYREGATHCYTCGAELVDEPRFEVVKPLSLGFAPLDSVATWFGRGPFRRWIATAWRDLLCFPRFFARGTAAVFRNPILYLLPLLFFAANHCLIYRDMHAHEGSLVTYETVTDRLSTMSGFFDTALSPDGAGRISFASHSQRCPAWHRPSAYSILRAGGSTPPTLSLSGSSQLCSTRACSPG